MSALVRSRLRSFLFSAYLIRRNQICLPVYYGKKATIYVVDMHPLNNIFAMNYRLGRPVAID